MEKIISFRIELELDDNQSAIWFRERHGYHFHLSLRRKTQMITPRDIRSNLRVCQHFIEVQNLIEAARQLEDAHRIAVFQIEKFSAMDVAPVDSLRFLNSDLFHLDLISGGEVVQQPHLLPKAGEPATPVGVQLTFYHPVIGDRQFEEAFVDRRGETLNNERGLLPIGGVRILVRDRIHGPAVESTQPFELVDNIQVLPRSVSLYRPIQIDMGIELKTDRVDLIVPEAPTNYVLENEVPIREIWATPTPAQFALGPGGIVPSLKVRLGTVVNSLKKRFREKSIQLRDRTFREELLDTRADSTSSNSDDIDALQSRYEQLKSEGGSDSELEEAKRKLESKIESRFANWTSRCQQLLGDIVDNKSLWPSVESGTDDWPLYSRLSSLMNEIGLCHDLVARHDQINEVLSDLRKDLGNAGFKQVKIFFVKERVSSSQRIAEDETTGDDTMTTFRIMMRPWFVEDSAKPYKSLLKLIFPGNEGAENAINAVLAKAPPVRVFRDADRDPVHLSIRQQRRVEFCWNGLRDIWHHDLDWTIQLLDRYHRIRERIRKLVVLPDEKDAEDGPVDVQGRKFDVSENINSEIYEPEAFVPSHPQGIRPKFFARCVKSIGVPRLEPLPEHAGIVPSIYRPPHLIAFEVLDSAERDRASHNVLTRTRYGNYRSLTPLLTGKMNSDLTKMYVGFHNSGGSREPMNVLRELSKDAVGSNDLFKEWRTQLRLSLGNFSAGGTRSQFPSRIVATPVEENGDLLQFKELDANDTALFDLCETSGPEKTTLPPRYASEVYSYWHLPYYLDYELEAAHAADYLVSKSASCRMSREPMFLGLPKVHIWSKSNDKNEVEIDLYPALLGNHLTPQELAKACENPVLLDSPLLFNDLDSSSECWRVNPNVTEKVDDGSNTPFSTSYLNYDHWNIPLIFLPDIEMDYTIYADIGTAEVRKWIPLLAWRGPANAGSSPDTHAFATSADLFGFQLRNLAGEATTTEVKFGKTNSGKPKRATASFLVKFNEPEIVGQIRDIGLALRRGALRTDIFPGEKE